MQWENRAIAALVCAASLLAALPANAAGTAEAEKIRRLDIMLMATSLRCRLGDVDFRDDFARFEGAHMDELNAAAASLRGDYSARFGKAGGEAALDRLSTRMANEYGQGHPWLACNELQMVARSLADMRGTEALVEAADQVLAGAGSGAQLAWVRR